jgi:uncharacterized C2H2 Zn-finger protein
MQFNREYKFEKCYKHTNFYCSKLCQNKSQIKAIILNCPICGKQFERQKNQIKRSKSGKVFCSRSCSARHSNSNKKFGTRVSKFESYCQYKLLQEYPNTSFFFNRVENFGFELDIFIPEKNLAFELNGILHYKPIYGIAKLESIKKIDNKKIEVCKAYNVKLFVLDLSVYKTSSIKNCEEVYQNILKIIRKF